MGVVLLVGSGVFLKKMMKICFSFHAIRRMEERGISKEEVELTLWYPLKIIIKDNTIAAMKLRGNGHLLIVIYSSDGNVYNVITVIDTSKTDKYL